MKRTIQPMKAIKSARLALVLLLAFGVSAQRPAPVKQAPKLELVVQSGIHQNTDDIAVSPDGRLLAAVDSWGTVTLWDFATASKVREFGLLLPIEPPSIVANRADADTVSETVTEDLTSRSLVLFSPDSKTLCYVTRDDAVYFWRVNTGETIASPEEPLARRGSFAFTPDGKRFAYLTGDSLVKVWNLATGKAMPSLKGHAAQVSSVVFSPDGKTLASADAAGTICLRDAVSGAIRKTIKADIGPISALSFAPDSATLVSGGRAGMLRFFKVSDGAEIRHFNKTYRIGALAFSPDGKSVAAGFDRGSVSLVDVGTGSGIREFGEHRTRVESLAFSPDGRLLVSTGAGLSGSTMVWNVGTGNQVRAPGSPGDDGSARSAVFSRDAGTVASLNGARIAFWDPNTGALLRSVEEDDDAVTWQGLSPDGLTLALIDNANNDVYFIDLDSGKRTGPWKGPADFSGVAEFSPDGKTFAAGGMDGKISFWSVATGGLLYSIEAKAERVAFSPDGRIFATGNEDGTIKFWDPANGKPIRSFADHGSAVTALAFSPDGKTIVSGTNGTTSVFLWKTASGAAAGTIPGYDSEEEPFVESISFSRDGRFLTFSGNWEPEVFWNVATRRRVRSVPPGTDFVPAGTTVELRRGEVFRAGRKSAVASIAVIGISGWIVSTPDGRFDGTEDAFRRAHFVVSDPVSGYKVIALDRTSGKYVRGLLKTLLVPDTK